MLSSIVYSSLNTHSSSTKEPYSVLPISPEYLLPFMLKAYDGIMGMLSESEIMRDSSARIGPTSNVIRLAAPSITLNK